MQAPRNIARPDIFVSVASEAYLVGTNEDGRPYSGERFYVQIDTAAGYRWAHFATFPGCVREVDPEELVISFEDIRPQAIARAEALRARILAAGYINPEHWQELQPAYGSDAYIREGTEWEMIQTEKAGEAYSR